jgi:hypothetical protein
MHATTPGVTYLDLDGDGVPDAVLTVETWPDETREVGREATVVETLACGIDIDGHPSDVQVLAHH